MAALPDPEAPPSVGLGRGGLLLGDLALRRIGQRLEIIGKTLDSDDRPPVDDAVQKLDSARTDLLQTMFRK